PRIVVVENVPDLAVRGLGRVLGDLCALGYDAEWEIVSAQDAGAPHLRKRLFILATHADSEGLEGRNREELPERAGERAAGESSSSLAKRDLLTWWQAEPEVGAVADGIPGRVAQLRALGNAVVPQVAELVGRRALRILERGAVDDDPWDLRP
ncbi:MAG: DNA cytosine methyltransferase, partial [bacterium]|nr:DNA cytosine methyltransferase [bacterium]